MAQQEGNLIHYQDTPTIDTDAYTAGDVIGGLITFRVGTMNTARIVGAKIVDDDNEKAELTFYFYDFLPSTFLDDAAHAPTVQDLEHYIGKITFETGDYEEINGNAVAVKTDEFIDFFPRNGNLYAYLVCSGTPAYTAVDDLYIEISVVQYPY